MSTSDDIRDRQLGDALDTLAGADEPQFERLFERVRHRGRVRRTARWTAVVTAVAVFVGGVAWAGLSIAGNRQGAPIATLPPRTGPPAPVEPSGGSTTADVPEIGLSMTYPSNWFTERISGDCMLDPVGLLVSNVGGPHGTTETSDGCRWPQDMGELASTAVVVEIDRYSGGPAIGGFDRNQPTEPPLPLSLDRMSSTDGPKRTFYEQDLTIGGDPRYQVFAWIGNDASPADREAAANVVASIADSRCSASRPGGFEPSLAPGSGSAGSTMDVSGAMPTYAEDGTYVGPGGWIAAWWDADPDQWASLVADGRLEQIEHGQTPSPGPGDAVFLGAVKVGGSCDYTLRLTVPRTSPGAHDVVVLQIGDGSAAPFQPIRYTVTP